MDVFRDEEELIAWIKTPTSNEFVRVHHQMHIYAQPHEILIRSLKKRNIPILYVKKKTYDGTIKNVLQIPVTTHTFERFIKTLEKETLHKVPLYNADIPPEQHFLYTNNLYPGISLFDAAPPPPLKVARIEVREDSLYYNDSEVDNLQEQISTDNPDVIRASRAFKLIPELQINCHRYKNKPLTYKGAKAYYSYGKVTYKDHAVRLNGRFLIDTKTAIGSIDADAILELCKLSSTRYQQIASRSAGSVFQGALMKELVRDDILIAHKQKPIPQPVAMSEMVTEDRAGISLDARVGIHKDVVEIDFTSMFPWLMNTKNISAETISNQGRKAPGVNVHVREDITGYVAKSLKPFLDARLAYKANPTPTNRKKAKALKAVLVSANGYLRYREFKLGLPTTHVALCAWVRHYFLQAKQLAEERGYDVLHGLVDSLYIHKKALDERDVQRLIWDIEKLTGIPMEFEGRFKWIVFLPSINEDRPVPTRYYGAYTNGDIKMRGIHARQNGQPPIIKKTQEAIIRYLAQFQAEELKERIPEAIRIATKSISTIRRLDAEQLAYTIRISKTHYKTNSLQQQAIKRYEHVHPGQTIRYVHDTRGIRRVDELETIDTQHYTHAMKRALYAILVVFGYSQEHILSLLEGQQSLLAYRERLYVNASTTF